MKKLTLLAAVAALVIIGRDRLVDLLTKTTGTWVGSPEAAARPEGP